MNPFMTYCLASTVAAVVWTLFALKADQRNRRLLVVGPIGAWAGALVLTAFWQAEAVPWLWMFLKAVLLVWVGAFVLMFLGSIAAWSVKQPLRWPLVTCALLSLAVHLAAAAHFVWIATVSPGGV